MSRRYFDFVVLALCFGVCAPSAASAQAHLVRDIRVQSSPVGSSPGGLGTVGNITYFFATLPDTGTELWKTDGTAAGTMLVSDICPGQCSGVEADYGYGVQVGNHLLFGANDGHQTGYRLWTTDGTASGTTMLSDRTLLQGTGFSSFVVSTGSLAYFNANDPATGLELWVTDGTVAGTHLLTDLTPGTAGSNPLAVALFGSRFLFRAGSNRALYITDGTEQGTHLVTTVYASFGIAFGDFVFLSVLEPDQSWSLWKTDGTTAGTTLVRGGFKSIDQMALAGGAMDFLADDGSGKKVWRSDGTTSGTGLLIDLTPASSLAIGGTLGGNLLIYRNAGELWISDGTAAGTRMLTQQSYVSFGVTVGQRFFFAVQNGVSELQMWSTDGTAAGTGLVSADARLNSSLPPFFVARPDGVFLTADDGVHGLEPWVSDGTAAGTHMLKDLAPETQLGSGPGAFAALHGNLLFSANDGTTGGLWTSDGTAPGTFSLAPFPSYLPYGSVTNGTTAYFAVYPAELWRSDGTSAGTFRLAHVSDSLQQITFFPFKNGVFFSSGGNSWFSDGTIAGTRAVGGVAFAGEMVAGDYVYGNADLSPYRTDGTAAGTQPITTSLAPSDFHQPQAFTRMGGSVYFVAPAGGIPFNLLRTDLTTTQAVLVHHFAGQAPFRMWSAGGGLMFFVNGALWRSDGTDAGTVMLVDGVEGANCTEDSDTITGDGILYWYNFGTQTVPELWRSDGTVPGTFKLASFDGPYAGTLQTCAPSMTYADGHLYFVGRDAVHGAEPWISDGTVAGTHLLDDVNPGAASSEPGPFLKIGPTLYFGAVTPATGDELWAIIDPDCASCTLRRRAVVH